MNEAERLAYERPNADHHIDFDPFVDRVVTITYHSDRAPGNCGLLAGTLKAIEGELYVSAVHSGMTVPVERVVGIELRDPNWPRFV